MSYIEKFCPECGTRLEKATICPKCGFEIPEAPEPAKKASTSKTKKSAPKSGDDSTWNSLEEIISVGGWLSWFLLMIAAIVMIVQVILYFIRGGGWYIFLGIWYIFSTLFLIYTIVTYGKIYSDKCKAKDWKFLMTDIITIGKFQIPKMLAYGVLLFIFSQGWGGFLVYVTAFLIYFLSPEKGTHKWQ